MSGPSSRGADHFEALYARNPDPWNFVGSAYERAKHARSRAVLEDRRYGAALEVGCSIGVLSALIAPLCDDFLGLDITPMPLVEARQRCAGLPQTRFAVMRAPAEWPEGRFDLILLSEVLYFLDAADLSALVDRVCGALRPEGRVLLVNCTQPLDDPHQGAEAADVFIARAGLLRARQEVAEGYRLDVLVASSPQPAPSKS